MKIVAHRGFWNDEMSKNSSRALRTALENGYGIESDVRDYMGNLVISHDVADASCQDAGEIFEWLKEFNDKYCFAINIKADGLKELLKMLLEKYSITNYFLFDMSVPQMIEYNEIGLRFFTRQSEIELSPYMYHEAAGIWIDGFWSTEWITEELLWQHIANGKEVCVVSPELHGRGYVHFWENLKRWRMQSSESFLLCTDHPEEAKEYFHG